MPQYIGLDCYLSLSWLWQFLILFLMIMKVLESIGELFCRMSLNLEFSDVLLVISQGLCVFKRKMKEAKCHFSWHHFKGICYQNDISLVILPSTTWLRYCRSGFSTGQLLFSTITVHRVFFGKWSLCITHILGMGVLLPLIKYRIAY